MLACCLGALITDSMQCLLMLQTSIAGRSPQASSAGAAAAQQVDVVDVLLACMHEPKVVAKLHLCSKAMSARMAAALSGRLHLCFSSSSTESVMSLALWLHQHAALLATLELNISVCCCGDDEAAADAAITDALIATTTSAPSMRLRSFSTTCSKAQLLSSKCATLPCLQHITHLAVPDILTEQQAHCLPARLCSLQVLKSTCSAGRLQLISQQCPRLQEVRLGYNLWPSRTNIGAALLDNAFNGWVLLPIVELQFVGCRLPR